MRELKIKAVTDVQVQINSELCWQGWNPGLISSLPEKSSLVCVWGGYFGSKSTMAGKAWQPEREAAGCAAFATGNRRVTKARAQLTLSYLCRRPWLMEWDSPYLECVFPLQLAKQTFPHKIGPGVWGPSVLTLAFFSCQPGGGSWKGKINVIVLTKVAAD